MAKVKTSGGDAIGIMNDINYIPDWYVQEPDERKAIHNISRIRKVSEKTLEKMTF